MKTTRYEHGTDFEESFQVTLRGEVIGQPCGWGCTQHEKKWLEDQLHEVVKDAVARFYQCQLAGTSLVVTPLENAAVAGHIHELEPKVKQSFTDLIGSDGCKVTTETAYNTERGETHGP